MPFLCKWVYPLPFIIHSLPTHSPNIIIVYPNTNTRVITNKTTIVSSSAVLMSGSSYVMTSSYDWTNCYAYAAVYAVTPDVDVAAYAMRVDPLCPHPYTGLGLTLTR